VSGLLDGDVDFSVVWKDCWEVPRIAGVSQGFLECARSVSGLLDGDLGLFRGVQGLLEGSTDCWS